jgi:nucleotide-binding universal stress UspA family protein
VRLAEEGGFDLVVTGTRGRGGMTRLVLGSVARSVLHHAHCSVLIAHGARDGG